MRESMRDAGPSCLIQIVSPQLRNFASLIKQQTSSLFAEYLAERRYIAVTGVSDG
jgi:hypothetical protein